MSPPSTYLLPVLVERDVLRKTSTLTLLRYRRSRAATDNTAALIPNRAFIGPASAWSLLLIWSSLAREADFEKDPEWSDYGEA